MSRHSEQVMKQRKKLKRVEILFRPEQYESLKTVAASINLSMAAFIKIALGFDIKEADND